MISLLGIIVVLVSVIGGFLMAGGKIGVFLHPTEYIIIGGAALGSLLVSAPISLLKMMMKQAIGAFSGHTPSKKDYMELLGLLFELTKTAKANPLAIEAHVDTPETSEIFKKYPGVLKNHHAMHFLCDTLKIQLSGSMSPYDLEDLMNADIDTAHSDELKGPTALARVGDAMPGLGIVAAVLGVVLTMSKLTQGKEVIGQSVAAALVGTFLGVLASYGFLGPLAAKMEGNLALEGKYIEVIKQCLLAFAKNCGPKVCVEFARRSIPTAERPTFTEVDTATSNAGGASKAA